MPFFGLATEGDLKRASEEAQTMMGGESLAKSIADINGRLNKAEECTQIINGVHLCSVPKYDKVVEPKDFKFGDFLHEKEKVCLHFDHIPDIIGTAAFERMSSTYGHGDIPDNYICYDGAKTSAYVDAIVPASMQQQLSAVMDGVTFDVLRGETVTLPQSGSW